MKLSATQIEPLITTALMEDAPWGDISSQTFISADAQVAAQLVAREAGVMSGEDVFTAVMNACGEIRTRFTTHDGEAFDKGARLATVEGPARAVLQAERVALNFIQRMSGIASLTALYVAETVGTSTRITDTRKTTPGLRLLERYAVRCGGGHNHRFSLSDAVMLKDNHLAIMAGSRAIAPSLTGLDSDLTEMLRSSAAQLPHTTYIEVEVDRMDQIGPVLSSGVVGTLMLDNFSDLELPEAVSLVRKIAPRVLIEVSGGVTLHRIRSIAAAGVDLISVGALTHSSRSLDLALDLEHMRTEIR